MKTSGRNRSRTHVSKGPREPTGGGVDGRRKRVSASAKGVRCAGGDSVPGPVGKRKIQAEGARQRIRYGGLWPPNALPRWRGRLDCASRNRPSACSRKTSAHLIGKRVGGGARGAFRARSRATVTVFLIATRALLAKRAHRQAHQTDHNGENHGRGEIHSKHKASLYDCACPGHARHFVQTEPQREWRRP